MGEKRLSEIERDVSEVEDILNNTEYFDDDLKNALFFKADNLLKEVEEISLNLKINKEKTDEIVNRCMAAVNKIATILS